jgi:hypothetical protein
LGFEQITWHASLADTCVLRRRLFATMLFQKARAE